MSRQNPKPRICVAGQLRIDRARQNQRLLLADKCLQQLPVRSVALGLERDAGTPQGSKQGLDVKLQIRDRTVHENGRSALNHEFADRTDDFVFGPTALTRFPTKLAIKLRHLFRRSSRP